MYDRRLHNTAPLNCQSCAVSGRLLVVRSCPLCLLCLSVSENEEGAKVCRQCGQKKSEQKAICGV
jgi:hypothetical protein